MNLILLLQLSLYFISALADCYDHGEETHQCQLPMAIQVDGNWYDSVPIWYIPLWNKILIYETAQITFGNKRFHGLNCKQLEQRGCASFTSEGKIETWTVFGGRVIDSVKYHDLLRPGVVQYTTVKEGSSTPEYVVTAFPTMTDDSTYVVVVAHWADGRKGFMVASPYKELHRETINEIRVHLKQLGFNPRNFVYSNYDNCPEP